MLLLLLLLTGMKGKDPPGPFGACAAPNTDPGKNDSLTLGKICEGSWNVSPVWNADGSPPTTEKFPVLNPDWSERALTFPK